MIAITGSAGFIGSALVWQLNKRGADDILVVDALDTSEKWRNLVPLKFADYRDKDDFITGLEQGAFDSSLDGIIHMGACSDTTQRDANFLLRNNYEYTRRLAKWSVKNGKRLVYASSAATYGDGSQGFSDDHSLLPKLKPLNLYGYSKHLFDLWAMRHDYLCKIAGLKYFNVFGPNEYHKGEMRSVAHKAFEQVRSAGKVRLFKSYQSNYEDGEQKRDFIYVKDAVEATLFIYDHPTINGIINVGSGQARSFNDLVLAIFHSVNLEPKIEYVDMPDSVRSQYQYFTQADVSKLRSLGYSEQMRSIEEAVSDYVPGYLLNKDPYLDK